MRGLVRLLLRHEKWGISWGKVAASALPSWKDYSLLDDVSWGRSVPFNQWFSTGVHMQMK